MANPEHLEILKQGVEVWNEWREKNPYFFPDLSRAYLLEANLERADLRGADLRKANLSVADLRHANLRKANLRGADLRHANLERADLRKAYLIGTDLFEANLVGTDLRHANLRKANLREANLETADLIAADLSHASLESVDLRRCDMIDSNIDGAMLTGAKLWESKRSGWSIKGVICEYAYLDREGEVKTEFKPGEFEKLYSEQTKIVLYYKDGLTQFEVTTLPALIQFIENKYPGSSLRLRTIGEDAGGASVTVAIDELGDADVSVLQEDFENYKERIREEVMQNAQIKIKNLEDQVKLLSGIIGENMGNYNIHGNVYGPVGDGASMGDVNIHNNDLKDISKLISDILAARPEIEKVLPPEKAKELNAAFEVIEEQAKAPKKNRKMLMKGVQTLKKVLDGVGDTAGKWMPIIEKLAKAAQSLSLG